MKLYHPLPLIAFMSMLICVISAWNLSVFMKLKDQESNECNISNEYIERGHKIALVVFIFSLVLFTVLTICIYLKLII